MLSPALRRASEENMAYSRVTKPLCQSYRPKVPLNPSVPHNCFCQAQGPTPQHLRAASSGGSLTRGLSGSRTAQPPAAQQLVLQPLEKGRKSPEGPAWSLPCDGQIPNSCICSHAYDAVSSRPPLTLHYGTFVYMKLTLYFLYSLMQTIFFENY